MLELRPVSLAQTVPEEEVTTVPIVTRRGYVAVPTGDVESYVRAQFLTFAAGFVVGMGIGAVAGNIFQRRG